MKYEFSVCDVYVMNALEEGYRFGEGYRVPVEWIEEVIVWEGLWFLVPACRIRFSDFGHVYLEGRHIGNVVVRVGLFEDMVLLVDCAVSSINDVRLEHTYRPSATSVELVGYGMPGLWLWLRKTKGYGEVRASEAVKQYVFEQVYKEYQRICSMLEWEWDIDGSLDRKVYLQAGRSGSSFLAYLRDSAKSVDGSQDYFAWFSPVRSGKIGWRFCFKSWENLKRQDVKFWLEYLVEGKKWDEVWNNGGYLNEGSVKVIPFLWYELMSKNAAVGTMRKKFADYWFDLRSLAVKKMIVDKSAEVSQGRVKSNILASLLSKKEDAIGDLLIEGAKDAVNKSIPTRGFIERCGSLRKLAVAVPGVREVQVGDKVRVIMQGGYGWMDESLSGDWIVGEIVHMWSSVGRNYMMKLILVNDALKSERKEVV